MLFLPNEKTRESYCNLLKWGLFALIAGLLGTLSVHLFVTLLDLGHRLISEQNVLPIYGWPLMGAMVVAMLVYRRCPEASSESIPSYIIYMRLRNGRFPFRVTLGQYVTTQIALATLNSGGLVGPLARVNAGILSSLAQYLSRLIGALNQHKINIFPAEETIRIFSICGFSAAVGAIFGSSIGAGVMAVEVIEKRSMGYRQLFPAILSSTSAVYFSRLFQVNLYYDFDIAGNMPQLSYAWVLVLIAISASLLGMLYIKMYSIITKLFRRNDPDRIVVKMGIGIILSTILALSINRGLLGTSYELVEAVFDNDGAVLRGNLSTQIPFVVIPLLLLSAKGLTNILTLGSGLNVGIVGPIALMGIMLGLAWAHVLGLPHGCATHYACIVAGFCGMTTSILNIPLASAIIAVEIFGVQYSIPAGLVTVISFQLTRAYTIYDAIAPEA